MISLRHEWHALTVEDALHALQTTRSGLDEVEVRHRQERFGRNAIPRKPRVKSFAVFARQFANPLVILLIAAGTLSIALSHASDAIIILITVAANVAFGFFQEWKSEKALEELARTLRETATVVRGGVDAQIDSEDLVPGDVVRLQAGDKSPADLRIIHAEELTANEAPLTGESAPVKKTVKADPSCIVFDGTTIASGLGLGVVVRTGRQTELGKIALSLAEVKEPVTPLQRAVSRLVGTMSAIVGVALFVPLTSALFRGLPLADALLVSVAIAVAAVPAGLVVSVTAILTNGMSELLKHHALVRRLLAAETLGAISVLAVDKTGTLTEGRMRLVAVHPTDPKMTERELYEYLAVSTVTVNEPTEAAILEAASARGHRGAYLGREIIDQIPFSSERGFHAVAAARAGGAVHILVGAPERLVAASALAGADRQKLEDKLKEILSRGSRVLGLGVRRADGRRAFSDDERRAPGPHQFLAFVEIADPPRAEVRRVIEEVRAAGVNVVMITGDNPATARAVATAVGIDQGNVYARVTPSEKLRIIEHLQEKETVAMTGDGVNDAPALKKANIGVVMGSGQAVAKEVADLLLLDDKLGTIVKAIAGGRRIFENIRKVVMFLLYDSFAELIIISGALLLGLPLPLLPAQILWVNLIEDSFPGFSMAFERGERRLMREPPRSRREGILGRREIAFTVAAGILTSALLLALYLFLLDRGIALDRVRTFIFVSLGIDSLFTVFALRRLRQSVFTTPFFGNLPMIGAVTFGFALYAVGMYVPAFQHLLGTVPLAPRDWGFLLGFGFLNLLIIELLKITFLRKKT